MSWNGLYKEFILQKTNKDEDKPLKLLLKKIKRNILITLRKNPEKRYID